jgi:hypothetical protein
MKQTAEAVTTKNGRNATRLTAHSSAHEPGVRSELSSRLTRFIVTSVMSTLVDIETAVPSLGLQELAHLEHMVRATRVKRERQSKPSALDLAPLNLGALIRPLSPDDDLLEEMMDDARA